MLTVSSTGRRLPGECGISHCGRRLRLEKQSDRCGHAFGRSGSHLVVLAEVASRGSH